jgi:stage III sporulation protein AH
VKPYKKILWVMLLLILAGATYWVISGLEKEMQTYDVMPDDDLLIIGPAEGLAENGDWGFSEGGAFFVEYRLQRDRVRAQEIEMLEDIMNNPNSSQAAREEAENLLLEIIKLMEQELLVENMIKAQGYDDAVFFYRNRVATLMVKKAELNEREFVQVTETVAGTIGIDRSDVQVITRP